MSDGDEIRLSLLEEEKALAMSERGKATGIRNKPVVSLRGRGNGLSRLAVLCLEEVYTK